MYPPKHHQTQDKEKMISVIESYPLAMLVSAKEGKPFITHIPVIYNHDIEKLVAHIDKHNPQLESLLDGAEVTVVFRGPDVYISPSIYTTPQLPTWNYIIVHITGTIQWIQDIEKAKETMIAMTSFLERKEKKYILNPDDKRMEAAIHFIQAFEIEITNWEGKFKLSQDKNKQDFEIAKNHLKQNTLKNKEYFIDTIYK
ncbi:MAG: transcriptional regulator [Bacteroidetes bacterium HGW-Bacteroidetes-2]|jgi:transcriptional regulator|nr:MAG: transcriptional regulator [Bacteroidetes bacterium HGW-Bacteroidetes-2]